MQDFRNLRAWQSAHQATLEIYRVTDRFPVEERYGLTSQVRRSAASVGANIAEACGRGSDADARRSLLYAMGSACETLNHVIVARDLRYIDEPTFTRIEDLMGPSRRQLYRLIDVMRPAARGREP